MKESEITSLAREYAEEIIENKRLTDKDANMLFEAILSNIEKFLPWLSHRFYLADKEKAKAFYNGDTFGELDFLEIISCRRVLKSLFPEIAKEVEG